MPPRAPEPMKVENSKHSRDAELRPDAHCDDRARAGHSGEGDRTDTDEMHRLAD
ncbi:hypothetical protein GCM10028786_26670 [Flaviaesturariibacter terrae]